MEIRESAAVVTGMQQRVEAAAPERSARRATYAKGPRQATLPTTEAT